MKMNDEIPRRSFFSALACSPLVLLGLRKTEPDDLKLITVRESNIRVKRWYDEAEWDREQCDLWIERTRDAEKDADHLRHRLLAAEKDTDLWRGLCDKWTDRALTAEKALKEAQEGNKAEAEEDAFTYEPVPLEKVGTIQVRYKEAKPLEPLPWLETT